MINVDALLLRVLDANLLTEAPEHTLMKPVLHISFANLTKSLSKGLKYSLRATYPPQSGLKPIIMPANQSPKVKLYETNQSGKHVVSKYIIQRFCTGQETVHLAFTSIIISQTRIGNLLPFGIDPKAFSRYLQTALACSSNLLEDPRCQNTLTAQTQGNHSVAISNLLTGLNTFFSDNSARLLLSEIVHFLMADKF